MSAGALLTPKTQPVQRYIQHRSLLAALRNHPLRESAQVPGPTTQPLRVQEASLLAAL